MLAAAWPGKASKRAFPCDVVSSGQPTHRVSAAGKIQLFGDNEDRHKNKARALLFAGANAGAGIGTASPPMVAGAMLLLTWQCTLGSFTLLRFPSDSRLFPRAPR